LRLIRDAGFQHVRINLFAFKHMDAANRIDPFVLRALDRVIERSLEAGLIPIIDEHDVNACQDNPETCAPKLRAFWKIIAARYARRYPAAVFEILNEPGGKMDHARWNALALSVLSIIRAADPARCVIVAMLNDDEPQRLQRMALPEADRNLILTAHYYKPFKFTHQGAQWSEQAKTWQDIRWGSEADRAAVAADFTAIAKMAATERRPVYLGEFGSYDKTPMPDRADYTAFIAREAERQDFAWAYWQFDHDFALFDTDTNRFNAALLEALIPARQ
jgi:endoglucanase